MTEAAKKAQAYWEAYCKEPMPMKRKWYGRLYEMWKDIADRECVCKGNPHIECSASHTVK